jgi:hypothetical protein
MMPDDADLYDYDDFEDVDDFNLENLTIQQRGDIEPFLQGIERLKAFPPYKKVMELAEQEAVGNSMIPVE